MATSSETSVWITGGASGLGGACAEHFQQLGASVVIFDISEKGQALADRLGGHFYKLDVSDTEAVIETVQLAGEQCGAPRVLINCAGVGPAARTVSRKGPHDAAMFQKTVAINLVGTYIMGSQVAALMAENEPLEDEQRGVIINTASVAAYDGQIGQCAYASSKAAVAGLTLPMARDLSMLGIRVCAIAPGIFATPLLSGLPDEVQQSLAAQVPFPPRLGQPAEFASLAQHIVENRMLNAEVIRLDGAIRMGAR